MSSGPYHSPPPREQDAPANTLDAVPKQSPGDGPSKQMLDLLQTPPKDPAAAVEKPKPGE